MYNFCCFCSGELSLVVRPLTTQDSPKFPFIRAERRRLRNWLSTNIPVQWGKRVRRIEHDDHGVLVYFEDGGSAKGDILIGADGINSVGTSTPRSR